MITMPDEKIKKFLEHVEWLLKQEQVSKRVIQSLIGKIIHFTACVPAARTFINQILIALRAAHDKLVVRASQRELLAITILQLFRGPCGIAWPGRCKADLSVYPWPSHDHP